MKPSLDELRVHFEALVDSEPILKGKTPLGAMTVNGKFVHYTCEATDDTWIGFALGARYAQSLSFHRSKFIEVLKLKNENQETKAM